MPSEKRQRQRENRQQGFIEEKQSEQRGRRIKLGVRVGVIAIVLVGAAFLYSVLTDNPDPADTATEEASDQASETTEPDDTDSADTETDNTNTGDTETTDTGSADADSSTSDDAADSSTGTDTAIGINPNSTTECPAEDGSSPVTKSFADSPPLCIDASQLYAADFETSLGNFTLVLDPSLDLASVNNFIVLARYGAFADTIFHRVISNFVIQGGDLQNRFGVGGPGYSFTGDVPPAGWYRVGAAAMANSRGPSTNGSQFFIITGSDGAGLPPNFSPLGHVTTGLDVVLTIDGVPTETRARDVGLPAEDVPVEDVVVAAVTIRDVTAEEQAAYEEQSG